MQQLFLDAETWVKVGQNGLEWVRVGNKGYNELEWVRVCPKWVNVGQSWSELV